jgi:tetratricopeptide (TPR) repeat protein
MKTKVFLISFILASIVLSCSKSVNYSPEHIKQTSGRYLYNYNEVIDVYYEDNKLFLKWKGASKVEPVVLDENTFFVADMYKKLRFVQHPETKKRYLGTVSADDERKVSYDYLKVADTFNTPRMYLLNKEYNKALSGYLKLKEEDSTIVYIDEYELNRMGYNLMNDKEFENAIAVFKMNVALNSDSENVYDSLADAYLRSGDSLQAYNNYQKALELNSGNERAKSFVKNYSSNKQLPKE